MSLRDKMRGPKKNQILKALKDDGINSDLLELMKKKKKLFTAISELLGSTEKEAQMKGLNALYIWS